MAKRAVLIGINQYRIPGADLRGCVNDVKNMEGILKEFYGFSEEEIVVLTDFAATKKSMESAIAKLVSAGRSGDILLLHYSGHGSNVPDNDGDEADRRDEILCPTDLDWKDPLRDDWLRTQFDRLRKGVSLTVIMDCCYSGTNTRAIAAPDVLIKERYLPSPWDLAAVESGRRLHGRVVGQLRTSSKTQRKRRDLVEANISEILLTGCRDDQTSADAYIGGSYNGALTYTLTQVIRDAHGQITYRDLHAHIVSRLKAAGFDQVPQLEAQRDRFDFAFLSALE
jgi:hypothetical protein